MNKIGLIIEREYLTRVRKKSFIIMSIVGPLLIASIYAIPIALAVMGSDETHHIGVVDTTGELREALSSDDAIKFVFLDGMKTSMLTRDFLKATNYHAVLYREREDKYSEKGLVLVSVSQPSFEIKQKIERRLTKSIKAHKIKKLGLDEEAFRAVNTSVSLETKKFSKSGKAQKSSTNLTMGVSYVLAMFVYMIIFLYGAQVMRGVIEEKTSRIIEVIISSIKPFQLMMGKILGIALVVLTQLGIWLVLSGIIMLAIGSFIGDSLLSIPINQGQMTPEVSQAITSYPADDIFSEILALNLPLVAFSFVFYFVLGYLTYAALFASIGAAVDSETDSQQFVLPISAPMILAIVLAVNIIQEPNGAIAFWLSIIPFTSPVAMMVRVPHGVPVWEIILSMSLLVTTFFATTWFAAKVYRTGILMYGKKASLKEIIKWIKY